MVNGLSGILWEISTGLRLQPSDKRLECKKVFHLLRERGDIFSLN